VIDFISNIVIPFLQKKWKTRKGLYVVIILILLLATHITYQEKIIYPLILAVVAILLWILLWVFVGRRVVLNTGRKKIIVFSFNVEPEAKKQYDRVIEKIRNTLINLNLERKIKLMIAAEDLISNIKEAHRYREKNNLDLVVWGSTFYGRINEKKAIQFTVNHTFRVTESLSKKLNLFLADIVLMLQKRKWTIYEVNDLVEYKIVADDFFETCLFIIGLYYFDKQDYKDAIKIFESILPISKNKSIDRESAKIEYIAQTGRINALLVDLYFLQSIVEQENPIMALSYLEKIPPKLQNNISILMNLAKSYYLIGDLNKAEDCTRKIKKIDRKHPAVAANLSFFGVRQKNYERAKFWYDELLKRKDLVNIDPMTLLEFLEEEYKKNPSEHAFLYGMAIINHFVDNKLVFRDLRKFLRLTKDKNEYEVLRKRAKELVK
jgi:tetratricopeptide (TPR) repeat protein